MNSTLIQWWQSSASPSIDTIRVWLAAAALLVMGALSVKHWRSARVFAFVAPVSVGVIAVARALQHPWIADDAFISFRFAANWAHGLGPVWNAGERVEGYTNPLWVALAALGEFFGAPAPIFISALNLLTTFVFIVGIWWALRRAFPDTMPVLPVVLALSPAVREFATSGLETLPATAAITFAGLAVLLGFRWRLAGALVCIAALLRPDHALFFVPLGLAAISAGTLRQRIAAARELIIPALVFVLFWLTRWGYYGDFFPNTYYAKSGSLAYWDQGFIYLHEFLASSRVWWPVVVTPALLAAMLLPGKTENEKSARRDGPFFIYALAGAALFLVYVARVGGDFMEFRFALTSLPLLGLSAEVLLLRIPRGTWALRFTAACIALLPLAQADGLIAPYEKTLHIARESSFYTVTRWFPLAMRSPNWNKAMNLRDAKPPPEMLAYGCVGMVGYYNPDVPIFDTYGKTSRAVAKRPITVRGRPGHEKVATNADLLDAGVVWSLDPIDSPFAADVHFNFSRGEGWLLRFDSKLIDWSRNASPELFLGKLRDPETISAHLDELEQLFAEQPELLERHLVSQHFVPPSSFTCDAAGDTCSVTLSCTDERLELFGDATCAASTSTCVGTTTVSVTCRANWLLQRTPAAFEERVKLARTQSPLALAHVLDSMQPMHTADFEDGQLPSTFTTTGNAIAVSRGAAPNQQPVRGHTGQSLVNTYVHGDTARGELTATIELTSTGESLIAFRFGGGAQCSSEFAEVLADGKSLGHACGENSEVLRRHAWVVPAGTKKLTVRVVDASSDGWGHLLFDDLRVWSLN